MANNPETVFTYGAPLLKFGPGSARSTGHCNSAGYSSQQL